MNLYLVNGFLGSGKTTAIANACKQLADQKIKFSVITNDQGEQQVDSAHIKSLSLPGGEVANGCFCCRYNELEQMVAALEISAKPEIIFAESVGSCTDLVATVAKPFALHHHSTRIVINVFADAYLLHSIIKGTSCFIQDAVQYIYKKQLEESDIIIINKTDLVTNDELSYVKKMVKASYPGKKIIYISSHNETDIYNWIKELNKFAIPTHRDSLELDYEVYGAGEAMLAWLDQRISVHTHEPVALRTALILIEIIYYKIRRAGFTIGHLKFLLSDNGWYKKISYTSNGITERDASKVVYACKHLDILMNARVQTGHQQLQQITELAIEETMTSTGCRIVRHQLSAFQPGYPKPVHRITE